MRGAFHCWPSALQALAAAIAVHVVAAPAAADPAAAQLLFDEATALRDQERWDEACAKFRASMKLDPSVGPLLNIAACHEREGRLASALADYEQARVMNRSTPEPERKQRVHEHIDASVAALRPRVPMLTVTVDPVVAGLVVTRSDRELPLEALGQPLPCDPGEVVVRARADGYEGEARALLREGQSLRLVVTLRPAPTPARSGASPAGASAPSAPTGATASSESSPWPWAVGGVGLGLGLAALGFGVWYQVTVDEMTDRCGGELVPCRPEPADSYDPADDNATKNTAAGLTVGFGVAGGLALGTAIVGLAIEAARDEAAPTAMKLLPGPGELGSAVAVAF